MLLALHLARYWQISSERAPAKPKMSEADERNRVKINHRSWVVHEGYFRYSESMKDKPISKRSQDQARNLRQVQRYLRIDDGMMQVQEGLPLRSTLSPFDFEPSPNSRLYHQARATRLAKQAQEDAKHRVERELRGQLNLSPYTTDLAARYWTKRVMNRVLNHPKYEKESNSIPFNELMSSCLPNWGFQFDTRVKIDMLLDLSTRSRSDNIAQDQVEQADDRIQVDLIEELIHACFHDGLYHEDAPPCGNKFHPVVVSQLRSMFSQVTTERYEQARKQQQELKRKERERNHRIDVSHLNITVEDEDDSFLVMMREEAIRSKELKEKMQQKYDKIQREACPFQPKTTPYPSARWTEHQQDSSLVFLRLYSEAGTRTKKRQQETLQIMRKQQSEFEESCTFSPRLNSNSRMYSSRIDSGRRTVSSNEDSFQRQPNFETPSLDESISPIPRHSSMSTMGATSACPASYREHVERLRYAQAHRTNQEMKQKLLGQKRILPKFTMQVIVDDNTKVNLVYRLGDDVGAVCDEQLSGLRLDSQVVEKIQVALSQAMELLWESHQQEAIAKKRPSNQNKMTFAWDHQELKWSKAQEEEAS